MTRGEFIKVTSLASAGLVLGLKPARAAEANGLGPFIEVGPDGIVTIYVSKSDMGQGVRTSLPMIVAEEMDADWKKVRIRQADLNKKYGSMGTGGSSSVRTMWKPLRQAGATARAMLVGAAAAKWGCDPAEIKVNRSYMTYRTHKADFGSLAADAAKLPVPKDVPLKDPAKFTIVGKTAGRLDNPDLVVGKSQYGIDVRVPGMLYAVVLHAPVFGAKLASVDDSKAKAVAGVRHIVPLEPHGPLAPWSGVGVVATSTWAAMKGRDALVVKWDEGSAKSETSASLSKAMHDAVAGDGAKRVRNDGDVDAALATAAKKLEATYEVPYLAHATMEPMNATASYTPAGLELWLPTQFADWAAGNAAGAVGLKPEQVTVHVTLLGGGFGRRAFPDTAVQAAVLSKAAGAPVKLLWSREDDMQHDFYRPAGVHRITAALDAENKITAWHSRMAAPSINAYLGRGDAYDSEIFSADEQMPPIANFRLDFAAIPSAAPRGWWRSVENSANAFVVQSFMDELAHAAGKDPIEFQLALIPPGKKIAGKGAAAEFPFETDRLRRVIELARDKSNWGKPLAAGRARGFAAWYAFRSYVAEVAEVSLDKNGAPRVHRVVAAVDCGIPVNPDGVAAQIEGGIVYGLTAALRGEITLNGGAVQQSNFHDYPLLTIEEMPVVEVHTVATTAAPTGTGEPGTPPIAPAVANAMFVLTGKRVRKLPITG